ncbi:MAG: hypothetical protein AAF597_20855, partial [Bacteroidota bacterium]
PCPYPIPTLYAPCRLPYPCTTLTLPVDSLLLKANGKQDAKLHFSDANGRTHNWDINVSLRGKFRRSRCEFAPLKLNFAKKDLRAVGLEDFDKYKLVIPCTSDLSAPDLVRKEYLAYRAYALLADYHFRVQLLEITFKDQAGVHPDRTEVAFLIENTKEMAARYEAEEVDEALGMPAEAYDAKAEVTHALLQYMVGNGDYSLPLARNIKVLKLSSGKLAPVGYDFDFSGWVGAPYATPSREIGQESIYERIYLGYAQDDHLLRSVATEFRDKRRAVINLVTSGGLGPVENEILWRWTSRFFAQLNRMNKMDDIPLYNQLRGEIAGVIPPGAEARSYQIIGK